MTLDRHGNRLCTDRLTQSWIPPVTPGLTHCTGRYKQLWLNPWAQVETQPPKSFMAKIQSMDSEPRDFWPLDPCQSTWNGKTTTVQALVLLKMPLSVEFGLFFCDMKPLGRFTIHNQPRFPAPFEFPCKAQCQKWVHSQAFLSAKGFGEKQFAFRNAILQGYSTSSLFLPVLTVWVG